MITISAFRWAPEFAQGQVRDLRVRLARYVERCVDRPAFKRACDAQMRDFAATAWASARSGFTTSQVQNSRRVSRAA